MYSICQQIIEDGRLEDELGALGKAERGFTREIGVIERRFLQCIQQPHVIWANTRWVSEDAHNAAAAGIMKVREDDRVASAYFRPGLYFEIFGDEIQLPALRLAAGGDARLVVIGHGLVADDHADRWQERLAGRAERLSDTDGLLGLRVFKNRYCGSEFVAFFEWRDESAYEQSRRGEEPTLEELVLVGEGRSELAAYNQYECRPLSVTAEA